MSAVGEGGNRYSVRLLESAASQREADKYVSVEDVLACCPGCKLHLGYRRNETKERKEYKQLAECLVIPFFKTPSLCASLFDGNFVFPPDFIEEEEHAAIPKQPESTVKWFGLEEEEDEDIDIDIDDTAVPVPAIPPIDSVNAAFGFDCEVTDINGSRKVHVRVEDIAQWNTGVVPSEAVGRSDADGAEVHNHAEHDGENREPAADRESVLEAAIRARGGYEFKRQASRSHRVKKVKPKGVPRPTLAAPKKATMTKTPVTTNRRVGPASPVPRSSGSTRASLVPILESYGGTDKRRRVGTGEARGTQNHEESPNNPGMWSERCRSLIRGWCTPVAVVFDGDDDPPPSGLTLTQKRLEEEKLLRAKSDRMAVATVTVQRKPNETGGQDPGAAMRQPKRRVRFSNAIQYHGENPSGEKTVDSGVVATSGSVGHKVVNAGASSPRKRRQVATAGRDVSAVPVQRSSTAPLSVPSRSSKRSKGQSAAPTGFDMLANVDVDISSHLDASSSTFHDLSDGCTTDCDASLAELFDTTQAQVECGAAGQVDRSSGDRAKEIATMKALVIRTTGVNKGPGLTLHDLIKPVKGGPGGPDVCVADIHKITSHFNHLKEIESSLMLRKEQILALNNDGIDSPAQMENATWTMLKRAGLTPMQIGLARAIYPHKGADM